MNKTRTIRLVVVEDEHVLRALRCMIDAVNLASKRARLTALEIGRLSGSLPAIDKRSLLPEEPPRSWRDHDHPAQKANRRNRRMLR